MPFSFVLNFTFTTFTLMQDKKEHLNFLGMAVEEAFQAMRAGEGGPFGALIVKDGKIIGKGHNTVLKSHDPTAHAEINAIRDACRRQNSPHLSGAVIYSNFEPCPMCLAAIYWADIRTLYYAGGRSDAARIGFMDQFLYDELALPADKRELQSTRMPVPEMEKLLKEWMELGGKNLY
jgi:tRNA(Arg) A34 adenosine deaminase TadA